MTGILEDVFSTDLVTKEMQLLDKEYDHLEETHRAYQSTANQFIKLQNQCSKELNHQKKRLGQLNHSLDLLEKKALTADSNDQGETTALVKDLRARVKKRKEQLADMEDVLPRKNDLYLSIILDGINVSFIDQEQRFRFKEAYEKFKLSVSAIIFFVAVLDFMVHYRAIDAVLHFLLVWYHCTLTIRESILIINGSRIKGWWRLAQFVRTVKAGIIIVWPDGELYDLFRAQFVMYTCYVTFLQFLQSKYQQGCLYRLRSLGERYQMDVTTDGFHSWMWRGLSFLLPFLYGGYIFQFVNAYKLFQLVQRPDCTEWQVLAAAIIFLFLATGNTITTSHVVYQKFRGKLSENLRRSLKKLNSQLNSQLGNSEKSQTNESKDK